MEITKNPPAKDTKLTPLMRQYWEIKSLHMDKVLLFRMGDFFEMFHDDAITAAPIVGIALTRRNKKSQDDTPMCGVPHHSVAGPINKLLKAGFKVAICDQVEDPALAKGLVKRAVTQILTPGMVYDPDTLESRRPNYLACFDGETLSFADTSTGESFFLEETKEKLQSALDLLRPVEIVLPQENLKAEIKIDWHLTWTYYSEVEKRPELPNTAQILLSYIRFLRPDSVIDTYRFERRQLSSKMELSPTVIQHLELFENYRGLEEGSLLNAIDRTKTSIGSRLLRQWLSFPETNIEIIETRQNQISHWMENSFLLKEIRSTLHEVGDLERRLGRLSLSTCNARDLLSLGSSIRAGLQAMAIQHRVFQTSPQDAEFIFQKLQTQIENTVVEDPPHTIRDGGMIRKGVSQELDELLALTSDHQSLLSQLEQSEREKTGISSLKVKYNQVFGFFIEVTHTHKEKIPSHYLRKQTLAQAERFTTEELSSLEEKVLSSRTKRIELEYQIFNSLKHKILESASILLQWAHELSHIDVFTSLAWLSLENNYSKPQLSRSIEQIDLKLARHPVLESLQSDVVANDVCIKKGECLLLTGPNMAGKSTLMRKVALISIMAQIGSFVPAKSASLPIYQKIFTRIGASDSLSQGLSTFMMEMKETAEMLKSSDYETLVVLDEIGRGTSTFDGLSLAQAILEHLLETCQCTVLFATHYHELVGLESKYSQLKNAHMSIQESKGQVNFLYTLAPGPARKSYGIQVAKIAGLPNSVTQRAQQILKEVEESLKLERTTSQLSLFQESSNIEPEETIVHVKLEEVKDKILLMDLNNTTPIEALQQLLELQTELKDENLKG